MPPARFHPEFQKSFRYPVETAYSLVYDTYIVTFQFVGEETMINQSFRTFRESGVFVQDSVHTFLYQANLFSESLKIKTTGMAGSVVNVALLYLR